MSQNPSLRGEEIWTWGARGCTASTIESRGAGGAGEWVASGSGSGSGGWWEERAKRRVRERRVVGNEIEGPLNPEDPHELLSRSDASDFER